MTQTDADEATPGPAAARHRELDDWSPHAFDLDYVCALTDDLEGACRDFAAGAGRKLTIGEAFRGVEIVFRRTIKDDESSPVTAVLRRGHKDRDDRTEAASGWHLNPEPGRRTMATAGPLPEEPGELARMMVELAISGLGWAPAALPPHVETKISFGGHGTKAQHRAQQRREAGQRARARGYDHAVRSAAVTRWHDARQAAQRDEPIGDDLKARLHRELSDSAWDFLAPDLKAPGPLAQEPLTEIQDAGALMSEVRAVPDWRPPTKEELYWSSEAALMVPRCEEGFAHAWLQGDLQTARTLLDEILRIGSPRDEDAGRIARARLALALMDGDLEVALVAGAAAMRRTGYPTLLDYLTAKHLLPEEPEDEFFGELARLAARVTDADATDRASRDEVADMISSLTAQLGNLVGNHHRLHMVLRDPMHGDASFWFDIDRTGLALSTTLQPDDTPAAAQRRQRLKAEGFTVDASGVGAQIRLWESTAPQTGEIPPDPVLERAVRLAVELLEELYDEDVRQLGWDGLTI
jgi:hypothetical protein